MAQEHVLRKVPEGRLHHVEVSAAHAVHERGQEVSRQAAKVKKQNKINALKIVKNPNGLLTAENLRWVVLHAAQGQAEGHVPTQLVGGGHESLQVVLQYSDRQMVVVVVNE